MKIKLIKQSNNESAGEIRLTNGKTVIDVTDENLKKNLEEFFAHPLEYRTTLESSDKEITATVRKIAQPNTVEFFRTAVYELLKFNVKGVIEETRFEDMV